MTVRAISRELTGVLSSATSIFVHFTGRHGDILATLPEGEIIYAYSQSGAWSRINVASLNKAWRHAGYRGSKTSESATPAASPAPRLDRSPSETIPTPRGTDDEAAGVDAGPARRAEAYGEKISRPEGSEPKRLWIIRGMPGLLGALLLALVLFVRA